MYPESLPEFENRPGWIEVITGSMFSGKTEELIRRLKRAQFANQKVEIFKPATDNRYSDTEVVSHNAIRIMSTPVDTAYNMLLLVSDAHVIGIDEAQFFDPSLTEVCSKLAYQGKRVIVAGLDMDFTGRPFGPMPQLMAIAEYVTKLQAICMGCGKLAYVSHRKQPGTAVIALGAKHEYEPLCRNCYNTLNLDYAKL